MAAQWLPRDSRADWSPQVARLLGPRPREDDIVWLLSNILTTE